jgi:heme A synthase
MAAHLVNTFFLLAAVALTAWLSGGEYTLRLRGQGRVGWLIAGGLILLVILGASGAVTALGDTLFPAGSLSEGISQDFLPTAHFLVRLRIYHPIIAVITGVYLIVAGTSVANSRPSIGSLVFSRAIKVLVAVQLLAGFVNVLLNVPIWMQLVHLLLADLLWIAAVLLGAAALAQEAPVVQPAVTAAQMGD